MTTPSFASKGTAAGAFVSGGSIVVSPTMPATINAGDVLVLFVFAAVDISVTAASIATTYGTWTLAKQIGIGDTFYAGAFYLVAAGTEDGNTITATLTAGDFGSGYAQVYRFTDSGTGLVDTGSGGTGSGFGTAASHAAVTTTLANQLALHFLAKTGTDAVGSATGETGGDWTEAAAEDTAFNKTLQCQTAGMASAGTITGGSTTWSSDATWRTLTFALQEAASGIPNKFVSGNFARKRAANF